MKGRSRSWFRYSPKRKTSRGTKECRTTWPSQTKIRRLPSDIFPQTFMQGSASGGPSENRDAQKPAPKTGEQLDNSRTEVTTDLLLEQVRNQKFEEALYTLTNLVIGPKAKETFNSVLQKRGNKITRPDAEKMAALASQKEERDPTVRRILASLANLSTEVGGAVVDQINPFTRNITTFVNVFSEGIKPKAEQEQANLVLPEVPRARSSSSKIS